MDPLSILVGLHLATLHVPSASYQHDLNPGAYVEVEHVTLGAYRNTIGRTSIYIAGTLDRAPFSLTLGAVSGYQRHVTPAPCPSEGMRGCYRISGLSPGYLAPLIAPSIHHPLGPVELRLTAIPPLRRGDALALHLSVEKAF
jgi:hypothetical protein